jgi:hypothetical protein
MNHGIDACMIDLVSLSEYSQFDNLPVRKGHMELTRIQKAHPPTISVKKGEESRRRVSHSTQSQLPHRSLSKNVTHRLEANGLRPDRSDLHCTKPELIESGPCIARQTHSGK